MSHTDRHAARAKATRLHAAEQTPAGPSTSAGGKRKADALDDDDVVEVTPVPLAPIFASR